jgi:cytochrome c peroxidase
MVGCVTCHDPEAYFADPRPTGGMSHGTSYTLRNTPSLVNSAYYDWYNWGGRRDSLSSQGATTLETDTNASSSRLLVAHLVYDKYKDEYEAIFGPLDPGLDPAAPDAARFPATGAPKRSMNDPDGPWEAMPAEDRLAVNWIMANIGKTYDAYGRKLVSGSSPFGRYIQDQETPDFSPAARRGLALFIGKAACNECHTGPVLSDNKFHNVGVAQVFDENTPLVDEGRFEDVPRMLSSAFNAKGVYSADPEAGAAKLDALDPADVRTKGQFRTPSLLNVALTAPYFHNGSARTLEDVMWHYDMGGGEPGRFAGDMDPKMRQLGLSDAEVSDLIAFLHSLTGEPVPEEWRADPFAF